MSKLLHNIGRQSTKFFSGKRQRTWQVLWKRLSDQSEQRWLSRNTLLVQVPWGLSAQIKGLATLPSKLRWLGQGRSRFCYTMPGRAPLALKLIMDDTHRAELPVYNAKVKWANAPEWGAVTMVALVQQRCVMAKPWLMEHKNAQLSKDFCVCAYLLLRWVQLKDYRVCELGTHNLALESMDQIISMASVSWWGSLPKTWRPSTKAVFKSVTVVQSLPQPPQGTGNHLRARRVPVTSMRDGPPNLRGGSSTS